MKSSNHLLFKQFLDSKNYSKYKSYNVDEQEFYKWLKVMQEISIYYTNFLEEKNYSFKNSNCAEISKSFFDTVVKPFDTNLITLYENGLNDIGDSRVTEGNLVVNRGMPIILRPSMQYIYYDEHKYDTFMTQNSYTFGDYKKLEVLHNSGNFNIIAGVFGFNDDCNKNKKIEELKVLRDSLYGDYDYDFGNKDGIYYCALGTKKRVRK